MKSTWGNVVGTGLNADPRYIEQVVKHLADISGLPLVGAIWLTPHKTLMRIRKFQPH